MSLSAVHYMAAWDERCTRVVEFLRREFFETVEVRSTQPMVNGDMRICCAVSEDTDLLEVAAAIKRELRITALVRCDHGQVTLVCRRPSMCALVFKQVATQVVSLVLVTMVGYTALTHVCEPHGSL